MEVPVSSIDQDFSRFGPSLVVMGIVETFCCDACEDTGPDSRNPSLDGWAVGPSPRTILSSTKL